VSLFQKAIEEAITEATGSCFTIANATELGGGCINAACCLEGSDGRKFFVKHNQLQFLPAFEEEARSLRAMAATRTIRVPLPVAVCQRDEEAALIMQHLDLSGGRQGDWTRMGTGLARMHRHTAAQFGWPSDNFIGSSPQLNTWHDDWIGFYGVWRLRPQIMQARESGLRLRQAEVLLEELPRFFADYSPAPALLHGDLWSGNAGFLRDGTPVVYDPACYYGDREADLAMTEMFGGFPPQFYDAYCLEWPLDPGYAVRKHLYNLYHLLNHFNLFGGGYGAQAESTITSLLTSVA